jgi:ion channel-forming bestrophin family protein
LTPQTAEERLVGGYERSVEEMEKVMAEKRVALDLIEGCV